MELLFEKQRDYIYTFDLKLPYANNKILSALQQETWQPDQAGYAQNSFPTRYRLTHPKNSEIGRASCRERVSSPV